MQHSRKVLVMDVGGGTSDVTLLYVQDEKFDVKVSKGDNQLGGEDFDTRLVDYCVNQIQQQHDGLDITDDKTAMCRLRKKCEKAKRVLSEKKKYTIEISDVIDDTDFEIKITRSIFESINEDLFKRAIKLVSECFEDAEINIDEVDDIVPVGGSMRIPRLREMLQEQFKGKPMYGFIDPDEAVACGAAVLAAQLIGTYGGHMVLSDVTPLSLGIAVNINREMSFVVKRNSKIPCIQARGDYTTRYENQDTIKISVYQGENAYVKDNTLLGEFSISDLKKAPAGHTKITVTFEIDASGILSVTAVEDSTNKTVMKVIENYRSELSVLDIERLAKKYE